MTRTRIALCADTHVWPNAVQRFGQFGSQLQPWSQEIQAVLLAELAAAQPDIVLHLGDFTCGGGSFDMPAETFHTVLAEVIAGLQSLAADFYGLPGNHDYVVGKDWAYAEQLLGLGPGLGCTIDTPVARLILLNAQGHSQTQRDAAIPNDPTYGWVNAAELARLEEALASAGARPVLIFCHQVLYCWCGDQPWADLYGIRNAAEVLAVLARYPNVKAIFQAHAHRLDVQVAPLGKQQCWFVVLPAVIEYPLAWLELNVHPGAVQCTLRRLPRRDLAELSRQRGDIDWRAGRPEWGDFTIPL
jgi:3',5'-cyclic AMP phosphodiesterase CpdA